MTTSADRVGMVGLGLMGSAMTATLRQAGWDVVITSRTPDTGKRVAESTGARLASNAAAVASEVDVVVLSLPDAAAVHDVIDGLGGVSEAARDRLTIIDTSTLAPADARAIGDRLATLGIGYLDAPVSGGPGGAAEGTLSIMVGGTAPSLERAKRVLDALGSRVVHCGAVGAGSVAKACNQLIVVATIGAVAEALAIADEAGVDPARVREALLGGWAASPVLELHGARMLAGNWIPGGKAVFNLKDATTLAGLTAETGVRIPVFEAAADYVRALVADGDGDLDHSAVYTKVVRTARTGTDTGDQP